MSVGCESGCHRRHYSLKFLHEQTNRRLDDGLLRLPENCPVASASHHAQPMGTATTLAGAPSPASSLMGRHTIKILFPRNCLRALLRDSIMKIPLPRRVLWAIGSGALNFSMLRKSIPTARTFFETRYSAAS